MTQKFYQKASVQTAIVVGICGIIGTLITVGYQRSEIRKENERLQREIERKNAEVQDLKRERDKFETQLAPFLANANQIFAQAPENERLDLLLKKVDEITDKLPSQRVVSAQTMKNLKQKLQDCSPLNIEVLALAANNESLIFAKQIKAIFEEIGWKITNFDQAFYTEPLFGIMLEVSEKPSPLLENTLVILTDEFELEKTIELNNKLPKDTLRIKVGENKR